MSWLYFLNYYIFQWLFIRLIRIEHINDFTGKVFLIKYSFLFGVYPLTGWDDNETYKYTFFNNSKKIIENTNSLWSE